jgi:hypothetical protein
VWAMSDHDGPNVPMPSNRRAGARKGGGRPRLRPSPRKKLVGSKLRVCDDAREDRFLGYPKGVGGDDDNMSEREWAADQRMRSPENQQCSVKVK